MKGIILAGGKGTRLLPLTSVVHKGLLPIYDKPMIYYPLFVLKEAGIQDILIISTNEFVDMYKKLLNDFSFGNMNISYEIEKESKGTAQSLIIAKEFIKDDNVCLIYVDNVFLGNIKDSLIQGVNNAKEGKATVFLYEVDIKDANRFGVVEIDKNNNVLSLEEKPINPKSNYVATGLYFYTNDAIEYALNLKLSSRGELEMTDVVKQYLNKGHLKAVKLNKNVKWIDAGNKDSLLEASIYAKRLNKYL